jgi:hypothetical protein
MSLEAEENLRLFHEYAAELAYRDYAKQLVPNIGDPPKKWLLAAPLCKWTGLQPSEFKTLTNVELVTFIKLAIEQKTGHPAGEPKKVFPPVLLNGPGERVLVNGKPKDALTNAQYNVVQALIEAGANGLTKDQIVTKSGHSDAVKILGRVAEIDADWKAVVGMAGKSGGRYRIKNPH